MITITHKRNDRWYVGMDELSMRLLVEIARLQLEKGCGTLLAEHPDEYLVLLDKLDAWDPAKPRQ
jgi:hypothetical protein